MKKTFYRVANNTTNQGLWYDGDGTFTGLIYNEFSFCKNHALPMPFDENVIGYLSATDNTDDLFYWFSQDDIAELRKHGYYVYEYEAEDYKYYENHWLINQNTSTVIRKLN